MLRPRVGRRRCGVATLLLRLLVGARIVVRGEEVRWCAHRWFRFRFGQWSDVVVLVGKPSARGQSGSEVTHRHGDGERLGRHEDRRAAFAWLPRRRTDEDQAQLGADEVDADVGLVTSAVGRFVCGQFHRDAITGARHLHDLGVPFGYAEVSQGVHDVCAAGDALVDLLADVHAQLELVELCRWLIWGSPALMMGTTSPLWVSCSGVNVTICA